MDNAKKSHILMVLISYMVFILVWILRVKYMHFSDMNEYLDWGLGFLVHFLWWFAFASILIIKFKDRVAVSYKEMFTTKPKLKFLLLLLLFAVVYNSGVYFFNGRNLKLSMKFYDYIITVLTVGIFEEIVFRGWFLNSLWKVMSGFKANIVSSLLFVLIHYPGWIIGGYNISLIAMHSVLVFLLGLLFGYSFTKTKSIWTGAIFHSVWDMFSFWL